MTVVEKIFSAGVVGAGGAGFPTYKKFSEKTKWLIMNTAECEPLLRSDIFTCTKYAQETIQGLDALEKEFGFEHIVIGIKEKHSGAIAALEKAIASQGSKVQIYKMKNFYPSGDEQVMVYEITGLTVPPGGIPLQVGVVVVNNTTVLNIYNALQDIPVTTRIVTVTGEVRHPVLLQVPIGTSVGDCIAQAGGSTLADYFFVLGGPMMGSHFNKDQEDSTVIGKQDGGIIVLPKSHYLRQFLSQSMTRIQNLARSACIQCQFCTDMCPRYLIGHQMRPHRVMRALATGVYTKDLEDAFLCCECGICELYACPMLLSPRQVNKFFKDELWEQGVKKGDPNIYPAYTQMYPYRKIPQNRIVARLQLQDYDHPIDDYQEYQPKKVTLAYRHGIGKPAQPTVKVGDKVHKGDVVAGLEFGELGAPVHASMDGTVTSITDAVIIER